MTQKILPIFLLALLVACSGKKQAQPPSTPPVQVDVIVAAMQTIPDELEGNGTVLSAEMVELHPETSGRLISLHLADGGMVKKGTLLAKINDAELQAQLRQQRVQLELARKNKGRFEAMLAVSGINQADYDNAVNQVASLEAAVDVTLALIDKTELRAPFDGQLGLRMVSPGAYVTPQTTIGSIVANGPFRIDFTLPEQLASTIKAGREVEIIGGTGEQATATVSAVDPQVNQLTRNVKIRSILKNGAVQPGAYVKVRLKRSIKGIAVPTQCIIPDATSSKLILVQEGKGKFVPVKTGIRTQDIVQITDGVEPGDSIIVTGVLFVRPNAAVKVRAVKESVINFN